MSLENYQVNAKHVKEDQYPWIARVVHSITNDLPHVCTAVCVDNRIFITAARCIFSLKIKYTRLLYQNTRLQVLAFVLPSKSSKQAFDDIGFIVVNQCEKCTWNKVALYSEKRTDNAFVWFANSEFTNYKVIGYATQKGIHRLKSSDRIYNLTELEIVININLCSKIMSFHDHISGFKVPCYHSCSVEEFLQKKPKCNGYHGVEGGAIFHVNSSILLGIATWGVYFHKYELPVGFSVVNSENFYLDFECAKRIKNSELTDQGYQKLCKGKK